MPRRLGAKNVFGVEPGSQWFVGGANDETAPVFMRTLFS